MTFDAGGYVTDSDIANLIALQQTWTAFTPVWTSTITPPSLGNGTATGAYITSGKLLIARYRLNIGSTTTTGTGTWAFELPAGIVSSTSGNNTGFAVGSCMMRDNSAAQQFCGNVFQISGTTVEIRGQAANVVGQLVPFTWAVNDFITFTMITERT
jgi:hypothetical protein